MKTINSNKNRKATRIAFFPDRLAHYRLPIFRKLSNTRATCQIRFFSSNKKSINSINLIDTDASEIDVRTLNEVVIRNKVFWQSKIIIQTLSPETDVVVCWGEMHRISTWIAALAARFLRKPFIMWTHGLYGNEGTLKHIVRTTFYRTAQGLLLYGNHSKSLLQKAGFRRKNIQVIYNSLDFKKQREIAKSKPSGELIEFKKSIFPNIDNERILIFCSRLVPKKDPVTLLEALALANKGVNTFKLIIVGDGPYKTKIQDTIKTLKLEDSVHVFGACYREEDLCSLFLISDMCISPGNIGLTALHSLAYGTPVATHSDMDNQMPEAEAVISGENGVLFMRNDAVDIVNKLKNWFADPPNRSEILEFVESNVFNKYNVDYQTSVFFNMIDRSYEQHHNVL